MKKLLALTLAVLMVLGLVACGGNSNGGGNGNGSKGNTETEALQDFLEAQYGVDKSKIKAAAPDSFWSFYESRYGASADRLIDEMMMAANAYNDSKAREIGAFTISLKDITKADVSADELDALAAAAEQQKGVQKSDVKAAVVVTVTVEFVGESTISETQQHNVVQIGNTWYVAEWYISADDTSFDFGVEGLVGG